MITVKTKNQKKQIAWGIMLVVSGIILPLFTEPVWVDIVVKIREAINTGDSGHLILASASMSFLYAVQVALFYLGAVFTMYSMRIELKNIDLKVCLAFIMTIMLLYMIDTRIFNIPWEPVTTVLALLVSLFISEKIFGETKNFIYVIIVCIQVFYAFQWLNIMPLFSQYYIGQSDIFYSIKIAAVYQQSASVLNFVGFAFFLPSIFSAGITATLFISASKNMHIMGENYKKENELQHIKAKAVENRIYQEINSLAHDLKTPLVTIRGLNSLITACCSKEKLEEYSTRIENSVNKMSEMISSFLYESSRQKLKATELMNYIRAQLPLEDESIKININIEDGLPEIYVNKVRIARAVINILENAIVVPCKYEYKHIEIDLKNISNGVNLIIRDNGIGIRSEDIPKIWEVGFSTGNTSGIGLPFAKQIIEDNKGSIEVVSRPDEGTTVTIFLPSAGIII